MHDGRKEGSLPNNGLLEKLPQANRHFARMDIAGVGSSSMGGNRVWCVEPRRIVH